MKRSKFNLSHYKLLTMEMGNLVPVAVTEVLPGDTFQMSTSALIRTTPLLSPVMHPVHVKIHHWFVPHRLVWDNWEDFITGGPDGMDESAFPIKRFDGFVTQGSLADYYGVPPLDGSVVNYDVSALPFRGYGLIFNEFYRDQDLVNPRVVSLADGVDTTTEMTLASAAWEKDYFTAARPWTQKGPDITLPLGDEAPVIGIAAKTNSYPDEYLGRDSAGDVHSDISVTSADINGTTGFTVQNNPDNPNFPYIRADLSEATSVNVNTVRLAFALQRYEEARARYGSRYTEYLRYLGVRSSDARLQRPEYLGGGKQTIQFSEVLQTGPDAADAGVASLKGHGISALRSNRFRRFFEEHGYIHSFITVRPVTMYPQGIHRTFLRRTKEDFWQKELEHIGQQEINNRELYFNGNNPVNATGTFGYADRYDEYRRSFSQVAGEFRTTLDYWHMARMFPTGGADVPPVLNASFVTSVPTKRIYAEQTSNPLQVMARNSIVARRQLSKTGGSYIY